MARIRVVLVLVAILSAPAPGAAQPAPPQPASGLLQKWTGEVVAIDTALGMACVRLSDGRVIKFRGSAATLKGYKIGDPMEGTFLRARAEELVRRAVGAPTPPCPLPPALRMTYKRWMDDTTVLLSATRDPALRAVDQALKSYEEAKDEAQRNLLRPAVQQAFDAWKAKVGDWRKSPHNKKGAPEILDEELSAKAVAGLSPDEAKALAVVQKHNEEALKDLFKDQKLVFKPSTRYAALWTAYERFKASRKRAGSDLPAVSDQKRAEEQTNEVITSVLVEAKEQVKDELKEKVDELKGQLKDFLKELAAEALPVLGKFDGPFGDLAKEWKDTAKALWQARKIRQATGAFAPGDPSKAFDAMVEFLDGEIKKEAIKAGVATGFAVGKLAGLPVLVVAVAEELAKVLIALHDLADDAAEAAKANALITQGKLDADLFKASPLLASYFLANSDTSTVIFMARPFGAPAWVRETEEVVKKARPVLDKAKELILSASYEIPGLRHMKGGTVASDKSAEATGIKKVKAKVDAVTQQTTDTLNAPSAGQAPAAPTVTPETAPPLLFAGRWIEWTEVTLRSRSAELKALDDTVKTWGQGRSDPEVLRDGVWVALKTWQAKEGPDWAKSARNGKGALSALEKKVAPAAGPATCPLTPADCNGPWSDKPRDSSWPPCADPPKGGCSQVVLGRFGDIQRYIGCPGYITLNLEDWSQETNDRFIACAAGGRLGGQLAARCNPPILIASGSDNIPAKSVTFREVGQLKACGCTMTMNQKNQGFTLACPNGLHGPVACPLVPRSCAGPWQNQAPFPDQPRPVGYPKCADPPWNDGKQVVLGRHDDIKQYIGCPGYITLNVSDWSQEKNDQFIACAAADKLGATANPSILIASGWDNIGPQNVTFRELTQLRMCRCTMEVHEHGAGRVDRCPGGVSASVPGLARRWARRACDGPPSGWELLMELLRPGGRGFFPAAARAAW